MSTAVEAAVFAELHDSPVGRLWFAFAGDGELLELRLPAPGRRCRDSGRRPRGAPAKRAIRAWIDAYFAGGSAPFPGPWRMPGGSPFFRKVYQEVHRIPAGRTLTYGEVAARCGSPGASRAVGNAMARNPMPLVVPCHRVLASTGMGGFGGGLEMKAELLAGECAEA